MVKKLVTLKKLPASMARGIGRIMVADSYLDLALNQMVYKLAGVGQKEGRLAIREPRAKERLEMVADLAHVHGLKILTDLKHLSKVLETSASNRDLVGHGVWFREPKAGRLLVRSTRGFWPRDRDGFKKSRRILPQGNPVDEQELAMMLGITEWAIREVEGLHNEIEAALGASPRKPQ